MAKKEQIRKAPTDNGLPAIEKGDETHFGKAFDVTICKGNIDLFTHINDDCHGKLKKKLDRSKSTRMKKVKKRVAGDDYGILIPEDERQKQEGGTLEEEEIQLAMAMEREEALKKKIDKLTKLVKKANDGEATGWLPGVDRVVNPDMVHEDSLLTPK